MQTYRQPIRDMKIISKELDSIIDITKQLDRNHIKISQIKYNRPLDFTIEPRDNIPQSYDDKRAVAIPYINNNYTTKKTSFPIVNKILLNNPIFNTLVEKIYIGSKECHDQIQQQISSYREEASFLHPSRNNKIQLVDQIDKNNSNFIISDSNDQNRLISKYSSIKTGTPYFRTPSRKATCSPEKLKINSLPDVFDRHSESFDYGLESQLKIKNNIQTPKRISAAFANTKFRKALLNSNKKSIIQGINNIKDNISEHKGKEYSDAACNKLKNETQNDFSQSMILCANEVKIIKLENAINIKIDVESSSPNANHLNISQRLSSNNKNYKEINKTIPYYNGLNICNNNKKEIQSKAVSLNSNPLDYLSME